MVSEIKFYSVQIFLPWWFNLVALLLAALVVFAMLWVMKRHKKGKKPS